MNILIMCGVNSEHSRLKTLMKYIEKELKKEKVKTVFWDVHKNHLPLFNPELKRHSIAKKLDRALKKADIVILGTPLYHNSLSGSLKNTLDHMDYKSLLNKKIGLAAVAGNIRTSALIFPHFRSVVSEMRGEPIYTTIGACSDDFISKKNSSGFELVNEGVKKRAEVFVGELLKK